MAVQMLGKARLGKRRSPRLCAAVALACAAGAASVSQAALNINFTFGTFDTSGPGSSLFGGGSPQTVLQAAGDYWENVFAASTRTVTTTLTIQWGARSGSTLATGGPSWFVDPPNYTLAGGTITFDNDGSSNFYVDPDPYSNTEYGSFTAPTADLGAGTMIVGRRYFAATSPDAQGRTDMLSVAIHEIGHALGMVDSYPRYDSARDVDADSADLDLTGPRQFPGAQIPVSGGHIATYTNASMFASIGTGQRKLLSEIDILALGEIQNFNNINLDPLPAADPIIAHTYTPVNSTSNTWSAGTNWSSTPVSRVSTRLTFVGNNATVLPSGFNNASSDNILNSSVNNRFQLNILDLQGTGPASGTATIAINSTAPATGLSITGISPVVNLNALGSSLTYDVNAPVSLGANTLFTGDGTANFRFNGGINGPTATLTKTRNSKLSLGGNSTLKALDLGYNAFGTAIIGLPGATLSVGSGSVDTLRVGVRDLLNVTASGTLDWSGASNFSANVGIFRVAYNNGGNAVVSGSVKLGAGTNNITAATEVMIGRSTNSEWTSATMTTAGSGTTHIKTPLMFVGGGMANATFTLGSNATLNISGINPGDRTALSIGAYQIFASTAGAWTGSLDTTLGAFNATLSSLTIGLVNANASASQTGSLSIGPSSANHLDIAGDSSNSIGVVTLGRWVASTIITTAASGTLTIGNLDAASEIKSNNNFACIVLATGNARTAGTLNLDGGTLKLTTTGAAIRGGIPIAGGAGNSIVNFNGTTLVAGDSSSGWIQTLTTANIKAGGAKFDSNGFDLMIPQPLVGTGGVTKLGAGHLTLSGACSYSGSTTVNGGTLIFGTSFRTGSALTVADGAIARLTPRTAGVKTLQVGDLDLDASGTLDLANNDLVVSSGVFSDIRNLVIAGFGTWGPGIISSTSDGSQILALFDNALVGSSDWNGGGISPNAIVGKYTYFGDANIDGQVTGDDYTVIDASLSTTPLAGLAWLCGDANLDGTVTGDDYTVIDANLGLGVGNPLAASALIAVPEPIMGGIVMSGALLGTRRRRLR